MSELPEGAAAVSIELVLSWHAGINFLSGGQSEEEASANLNAMNRLDTQRCAPSLTASRLISSFRGGALPTLPHVEDIANTRCQVPKECDRWEQAMERQLQLRAGAAVVDAEGVGGEAGQRAGGAAGVPGKGARQQPRHARQVSRCCLRAGNTANRAVVCRHVFICYIPEC